MIKLLKNANRLGVVILTLYNLTVALNPEKIVQSRLESQYAPIGSFSHPTDNKAMSQELATGIPLKQNSSSGVLGSLFELGVSEITKHNPVEEKNQSPIESFLKELGHMPFLPLSDVSASSFSLGKDEKNGSPMLQYLDLIRGGAWGQFKSLALSYSNWLEEEYQIQDISNKLPIPLIKKILDLGDRVNFLHVVGKKVDLGLAQYLADKMQPLFTYFDKSNPGRALSSNLSSTINSIIQDTAWKTMHQFVGHVLDVAGRFVSKKEIMDFQLELSKSSPLVAKGLDLIMNGPPNEVQPANEGRSLTNRKGYYDFDDPYAYDSAGYGGYGAHDESYGVHQSYGYNSGVHLDPYLILGGLGAAALLAFLAYRVIVTTGGGERRKRSDDLTFMELSDMPNLVYSFYNMLEDADSKYGGSDDTGFDDADDLVSGLNSLWYEHKSIEGCIRCSLYKFVEDHFAIGTNAADALLAAGIAHILGAENSGQLLDEVGSAIVGGHQNVQCLRHNSTCSVTKLIIE